MPCELWLDGAWVPGWTYVRLTDEYHSSLRIEAFRGDEVRVWQSDKVEGFELEVQELLVGAYTDNPEIRPAWRMPITLQVRREGVLRSVRGIYELGLQASSHFSQGYVEYARLYLEGADEPVVNVSLLHLLDWLPEVECCGNCQFGADALYGGGDGVFGLHCFRDARHIMADRGLYIDHAHEMSEVAHPHTPVYHRCPSYQRYDSEYQQWTAENPPNPGVLPADKEN